MYRLLTKRELKVAGYWPNCSFCVFYGPRQRKGCSRYRSNGQRVIPSGEHSSILPARVGNHSAGFDSSFPASHIINWLIFLRFATICLQFWCFETRLCAFSEFMGTIPFPLNYLRFVQVFRLISQREDFQYSFNLEGFVLEDEAFSPSQPPVYYLTNPCKFLKFFSCYKISPLRFTGLNFSLPLIIFRFNFLQLYCTRFSLIRLITKKNYLHDEALGAYHLNWKPGYSNWKIKWYASFHLEYFWNYGLLVKVIHFCYSQIGIYSWCSYILHVIHLLLRQAKSFRIYAENFHPGGSRKW